MPYYAQIEQYESITELPDKNFATGFRIERRLRWRVIEENRYTDYRKELINLNTLWAAECFRDGWNLCIDALLNELDTLVFDTHPDEGVA